ncbi:MAG: conjugal transfer protein TraB [Thermodesulfobacteriota bacterium]|nr:conjugal transfer protein TraB [Thermodesulfobacteriota bacterium]
MKQEDELVLKVTKEIVIKLIEMGRLSVSSFDEAFKQIHQTVYESLMETSLDIDIKDEDH